MLPAQAALTLFLIIGRGHFRNVQCPYWIGRHLRGEEGSAPLISSPRSSAASGGVEVTLLTHKKASLSAEKRGGQIACVYGIEYGIRHCAKMCESDSPTDKVRWQKPRVVARAAGQARRAGMLGGLPGVRGEQCPPGS